MLFVITVVVILAYAALVYVRLRINIARSAILVEKSRPYEQHPNHPRLKILVLGDSTAVGTGVSNPHGSIAGRFGADFPDADIQNFGINGLRVSGLQEQFPTFPPNSFDLVVLQIGANDIVNGTRLEDFSASLSAVFSHATAIGKHVIALHSGNIGLAPIFQWPLNLLMRKRTLAVRELYRDIAAQHGVLYVDLFHEATDDPFKGEGFYAADNFHPTEKGYGVWYGDVREVMRRAEWRDVHQSL